MSRKGLALASLLKDRERKFEDFRSGHGSQWKPGAQNAAVPISGKLAAGQSLAGREPHSVESRALTHSESIGLRNPAFISLGEGLWELKTTPRRTMSLIGVFRQPRLKVMHTFDSEASAMMM